MLHISGPVITAKENCRPRVTGGQGGRGTEGQQRGQAALGEALSSRVCGSRCSADDRRGDRLGSWMAGCQQGGPASHAGAPLRAACLPALAHLPQDSALWRTEEVEQSHQVGGVAVLEHPAGQAGQVCCSNCSKGHVGHANC